MTLNEIFSIIDEDLKLVEDSIHHNIQNKIELISSIGSHIFGSGGKRLRPALLLLACKLFDYKGPERIYLSSAIEYIHTATLLHDDVVDNSVLRRGKQSANSIWGNEASVLVGDFLFAKAFILIVGSKNIRVLNILSNATGNLAEGEIFELVKTGDLQTSINDYFEIIKNKTGVLFSAACEIAAVLADAPHNLLNSIKSYGDKIGVAFQLIDDALDYASTDVELGKKIGIDIQEGKVTLPLIAALTNANSDSLYSNVKEIFYKDSIAEDDINFLKNFVLENRGVEDTIKQAHNFISQAKEELSIFHDSPAKTSLLLLADFILKRRF